MERTVTRSFAAAPGAGTSAGQDPERRGIGGLTLIIDAASGEMNP